MLTLLSMYSVYFRERLTSHLILTFRVSKRANPNCLVKAMWVHLCKSIFRNWGKFEIFERILVLIFFISIITSVFFFKFRIRNQKYMIKCISCYVAGNEIWCLLRKLLILLSKLIDKKPNIYSDTYDKYCVHKCAKDKCIW